MEYLFLDLKFIKSYISDYFFQVVSSDDSDDHATNKPPQKCKGEHNGSDAPRVVKQRRGKSIDLVGQLIGIPFCSRTIKLIKRKRTKRKKRKKGKKKKEKIEHEHRKKMRPSRNLTEVKHMERTEHAKSSMAKLNISEKSAQQPRRKLQTKCALSFDPIVTLDLNAMEQLKSYVNTCLVTDHAKMYDSFIVMC